MKQTNNSAKRKGINLESYVPTLCIHEPAELAGRSLDTVPQEALASVVAGDAGLGHVVDLQVRIPLVLPPKCTHASRRL